MRTRYIPPIVFGFSWLAFLAYWAFSASQLPARVAIHFNLAGQPNGWMTRTQYVAFSAAMGLGLPLVVVGLFYLMRFLPSNSINFPGTRESREYWLAPERRAVFDDYTFRQSYWLASMTIGLIAGLHYLMIQANRLGAAMAHISLPAVLSLTGCFVLGVVLWIVLAYCRFRRR